MTSYGKNNLIGNQQGTTTLWFSDARMWNVLLFVAVLSGFISYLALNNQTASKNFLIRSTEKRIANLNERRQQLDLQVVAGQSMDTLDGKIQGLGFVPVANIDYLSAPGGYVAVK